MWITKRRYKSSSVTLSLLAAFTIIVISIGEWNSISLAFNSRVSAAVKRASCTSALAMALASIDRCAEVRYTRCEEMRGRSSSTSSLSICRARAMPFSTCDASCSAKCGASSLARALKDCHQASSSRPARAAAEAARPRPSPSSSRGSRRSAKAPSKRGGVLTPPRLPGGPALKRLPAAEAQPLPKGAVSSCSQPPSAADPAARLDDPGPVPATTASGPRL
mmetsp:Transcript_125811/g.402748  ORF Transcript_125811/g.402748 Transcript_125811/m.402748 type:complete len:221 (+) Transcript_125811:973-1635(+)